MFCMHDEEETECADQLADCHHDVPPEAVYLAAHVRCDQAGNQKAD